MDPSESDRTGKHVCNKHEQNYSDYFSPEGPLVNGSFIDCGSLSHPQWSDLNDWNPPQNKIQLSEVTDLEVVGVEGFELLRPVGLEENQPYLDVEDGIRQEALRDQEDYLRGVQGGVDCQEEEQLPHLEEVHVAEAGEELETRGERGRGRRARRRRQEANRMKKATMEAKDEPLHHVGEVQAVHARDRPDPVNGVSGSSLASATWASSRCGSRSSF